jgi:hypothetical protein
MPSAQVSWAAMADVMAGKMMSSLVRRSLCCVGWQCHDGQARDDHEQ